MLMSTAERVRGYCIEWFSEAHGITTEEAEDLFARCDLNDYIREDYFVFGHKGRNTSIRVCRNYLKRHGIDVPDLIEDVSDPLYERLKKEASGKTQGSVPSEFRSDHLLFRLMTTSTSSPTVRPSLSQI